MRCDKEACHGSLCFLTKGGVSCWCRLRATCAGAVVLLLDLAFMIMWGSSVSCCQVVRVASRIRAQQVRHARHGCSTLGLHRLGPPSPGTSAQADSQHAAVLAGPLGMCLKVRADALKESRERKVKEESMSKLLASIL